MTASPFKKEELELFVKHAALSDGIPVHRVIDFDVRRVEIPERLEIDLETMVRHEVVAAYVALKVPCVVEHAGLIFAGSGVPGYPGGLTKPMWNTLGADFVKETNCAGRRATAKAAVAYCDGTRVSTFVGLAEGRISETPKGNRAYYWDTVFVPDDPDRAGAAETYAEIVDNPALGLVYKVRRLSQSSRALLACVEHLRRIPVPALWS